MDGSDSDMHLSEDELKSVYGSDNQGQHIPWVRKRNPEFNPKTIIKDLMFQVGQTFTSVDWF